LLDTNAVLYLLGGRLAESLEVGHYYVSVISEMELLSYPKLTNDAAHQIRSFLADVTVVELTKDVKTTAIELRREHALKNPDAIIWEPTHFPSRADVRGIAEFRRACEGSETAPKGTLQGD
jgi:predicted nucleic acid-binding protein